MSFWINTYPSTIHLRYFICRLQAKLCYSNLNLLIKQVYSQTDILNLQILYAISSCIVRLNHYVKLKFFNSFVY